MSCVPLDRAGDVADLAANIRDTERSQAARMQLRTSLRSQSRVTSAGVVFDFASA
jgi:hypothetical protein